MAVMDERSILLSNRQEKPPAIEVVSDNIPKLMKDSPRWIAWDWKWSGKKWTKEPRCVATGKMGSSTNQQTWCTFDDAYEDVMNGDYDGLGFCLGEDTEADVTFCGADSDSCRDIQTDIVVPSIQSHVELLDSYCEVSPTRTGLKAVLLGTPKRTGTIGPVEVYCRGRFFCITGHIHHGCEASVNECEDQINRLIDLLTPSPEPQPNGAPHGTTKDRSTALEALQALDTKRADDYEMWLKVGMVLHGLGNDLLNAWDKWSRRSAKYVAGECARKWKSFSGGKDHGVSLGTLIRWAKQDGWQSDNRTYHLTDYGNAERFVRQHGNKVRYCHAWQKWLVWDGQRWAIDESAAIERFAKQTVRTIYKEAADELDKDRRGAIAKWAQGSEKVDRLSALLKLARSEPGIPITPDQLDADPWLLNVANGTINLKTGELRPHRREDLITKLAPVEYPTEPGCDADIWSEFLNVIFADNRELVAFVQRLVGSALVGQVHSHILPIFYGTGSNGKVTFCETIIELLGDYGGKAPQGMLMASYQDKHPTKLTILHGKRFVVCNETEDGRRLSEALVKELTGGDTIQARRMREDFWHFKPRPTRS